MKKLPKFQRPNRRFKKRVGDAWRKPRGIDSKQRMQWKSAGAVPKIGYRTAREWRGLHPSGYREVEVRNVSDLKKIDSSKEAARIYAGVGGRKRKDILNEASERGIKVLNA